MTANPLQQNLRDESTVSNKFASFYTTQKRKEIKDYLSGASIQISNTQDKLPQSTYQESSKFQRYAVTAQDPKFNPQKNKQSNIVFGKEKFESPKRCADEQSKYEAVRQRDDIAILKEAVQRNRKNCFSLVSNHKEELKPFQDLEENARQTGRAKFYQQAIEKKTKKSSVVLGDKQTRNTNTSSQTIGQFYQKQQDSSYQNGSFERPSYRKEAGYPIAKSYFRFQKEAHQFERKRLSQTQVVKDIEQDKTNNPSLNSSYGIFKTLSPSKKIKYETDAQSSFQHHSFEKIIALNEREREKELISLQTKDNVKLGYHAAQERQNQYSPIARSELGEKKEEKSSAKNVNIDLKFQKLNEFGSSYNQFHNPEAGHVPVDQILAQKRKIDEYKERVRAHSHLMGSDRESMTRTPAVVAGSHFANNDVTSQREQIKKQVEKQHVNLFDMASQLKDVKLGAGESKEGQNKQSIQEMIQNLKRTNLPFAPSQLRPLAAITPVRQAAQSVGFQTRLNPVRYPGPKDAGLLSLFSTGKALPMQSGYKQEYGPKEIRIEL